MRKLSNYEEIGIIDQYDYEDEFENDEDPIDSEYIMIDGYLYKRKTK